MEPLLPFEEFKEKPSNLPPGLAAYLDAAELSASAPVEAAAPALLLALGAGPGSRIAMPVWGCTSLAERLNRLDYEILPIDIDPDTGRMDISSVARETQAFEILWMTDVNGLPPEATQLAALARSRDALVVEEARESLGAVSQGQALGSRADAVLLRVPGGQARIASAASATVSAASRELTLPAGSSADTDAASMAEWLKQLPGRLASQRRLAALWESAWGPLDALRLPEYSPGTRGTWPRFSVRLLVGDSAYPNATWARWLKSAGVKVGTPSRRLIYGLDPDDEHVRRQFPGATEYLRRCLCFACGPEVTLDHAERTVYTVDELARRESGSRQGR